ncbi:MAG: MFS transporter [Pseudomonadota bacterium]
MARDLRLFYLFRLLATSYLFVPVSVAYAISRGLGFVEIGLLNTIYSLVVILTEVPTGALADRYGRRAAMTAGALAMVGSCGAFLFASTFTGFAIAQGLAALSMTLCSGSDSAYLFDLLNDRGRSDEYPRHEGTSSAWHQAGNTVAFAAGGLLGARDLALPFVATGFVAAAAAVVALGMRADRRIAGRRGDLDVVPSSRRTRSGPSSQGEPGQVASVEPSRLLSVADYIGSMKDSFVTVASKKQLLWAIGYSTVVFVLLRATIDVYQPYLKSAGYSIADTGLVFAAVYLVAAAVAHRADALRHKVAEPVLLWGLLGTLAVTLLLLGGTTGPWCLVVLLVQAPANGLYSPLVKPLLNREIPESQRRATVLSVESMVRRMALGLVWPIIGGLMQAYGPSAGLTVCGLIGLVGMGILAATARAYVPGKAGRAPAVSPPGVLAVAGVVGVPGMSSTASVASTGAATAAEPKSRNVV